MSQMLWASLDVPHALQSPGFELSSSLLLPVIFLSPLLLALLMESCVALAFPSSTWGNRQDWRRHSGNDSSSMRPQGALLTEARWALCVTCHLS
jgi:hypothetical protein